MSNNYNTNSLVSGTSSADTINNYAGGVTIQAGAGDDSIHNSTSSDYTINNSWGYVTIDAGDGADTIYSNDPYVSINGGYGNDSINNRWTSNVTIDAGSGNDTILTRGGTVKGSYGNDVISLESSGYNKIIQFASGDGYDTIYNFDENSVVSLPSAASYKLSTVGSSVVISLSSGSMTLLEASGKTVSIIGGNFVSGNVINNYSANSLVSGTSSADIINNYADNVTIKADAGNDKIYNSYVNYVSVNGGTGNDSISDYSAWYSTINAGDGADTIEVPFRAWKDSINGGAGNDKISLSSSSDSYNGENTVVGGTGDDTIYGNATHTIGNTYQYNYGDGYDSILNWNDNDTLSLGSGIYYTRSTVGSNVVVSIQGGGAITLGGASSKTVSIDGGTFIPGKVINNYNSNSLVSGTSDAETIKNYASYVTINAGDGRDSVYNSAYYVTINAGSGADTVNNYSGDNVLIDGGAGADSIVGYSYNWYDTVNGGADNDTIIGFGRGASINGGAGADIVSLGSASDIRTVKGGTGNDTLYGYAGSSYGVLYQYDYGDGYDSILNWNSNDTLSFGSGINYTRSTVGSDVVVSIQGGGAITLGGASGKTINIFNPNPVINNYNSNSLVSGTSSTDTINNYASYVTISADAGNDKIYNDYVNYVSVSGGTDNDSISNKSAWYSTIDAGDGADTIEVPFRAWKDSINGGAGNDKISLSSSSDSYNGKNTVVGGMGDDTIYGNATHTIGNTYQYNYGDGYDSILNWNGNDTLSLGSGIYYTSSTVGSNVVVSIQGGGAITLGGASSKTVGISGGTLISGKVINNYNSNSLVSGTSSAETINNYASYVTINAGAGRDSVYNSAYYVTINAGSGADTVNNYSGDNVLINGDAGADSIVGYSYNWYDTIDGGADNDTIIGFGRGASINGGAGADIVSLGSASDTRTVKGGTGNDTLYGYAGSSYGVLYQYGYGDGYDSIINWNNYDTLSFGTGSNVSYSRATVGTDVIFSITGGGAITISGGKGKTIYVDGGVDIGKTPKGTLITNSTSNVVLTGTIYNDTISNHYGTDVTINAGAGNDTIYNWADKVTVNGGDGKDSLTGGYSNSKINGDAGSDLISLTGAYWRNTINGGGNNDTITSAGNEHSVLGGAGADRISLSGDKLTVNGGTGNDTIYGSTTTSHLYEYQKGDGNDVIYNWSSNDTLTLTGGANWTSVKSGSNVIITVEDSGKITLGGASGKTINIYPTATPPPSPTPTVTPQEVIKKFMKSLDTTSYSGIGAVSQAVSVATGGYFSNVAAAIEQMTLDCASAGNATNFLETYCDINLSNSDTGAITGYDAGGSAYQKTASGIIPESGTVNNFTDNYFTTKGLTVKLSSFDNNYNPYSTSYTNLTNNNQKYIWQAFQTWWASGALNLIEQSYGNNYGFSSSSSAPVKTLFFGFENENSGVMATTYYWTNQSTGKNTQLAMTVNMHNYDSLIIGNSDGQISGYSGFYLDRVFSHEFTHAVMAANMNYFGNLPMFIKEGMAELTHGTDDDRKSEITALAQNSSSLKSALNLYSGSYSAYAGGYMFLRYLAKQGSLHYPSSSSSTYAPSSSRAISQSDYDSDGGSSTVSIKGAWLTVSKDFADDMLDLTTYSSSVKNVDATALTRDIMILGGKTANSILAGSGSDTVSGNTGNDKIFGGEGHDILLGDAGNDKLYGNDGNDSLSGGTGNDTLWGGVGEDVFIHKADNDYIYDYVAGEDKIKLAEEFATITSSALKGNDVVLMVGNGSITVKDGKDQKITIVDYEGNSTSSVYGGGKNLTLTNKSESAVTLSSEYQNANASKRTKAIKITGNDLDNTIIGGKKKDSLYGGAGNDSLRGNAGSDKLYGGSGADTLVGGSGNDSLWGGKGNDSLWGGTGNDTFVYKPGEGTDKIFDYASGDMLKILKTNGKSGGTFTKSNFNNGTLTLTISGGGSVIFDGVSTGDKFKINGTSYTLSGKSLTK